MKRSLRMLVFFILVVATAASSLADSSFSDDRFQGVFTTQNIDAIIQEYELQDGWYWTTPGNTAQTYHGFPECPGWTDTSVNLHNHKAYRKGWYGCRWGIEKVRSVAPDQGGWGECFGFAMFIGYLLSGDRNPMTDWNYYRTLESAGGFQVGDIIRVEYRANKKSYRHSAVVYAVNGDEVLFLQISGSNYNRISVGKGFTDGNHVDESNPEVISSIPSFRLRRSKQNAVNP